MKSPFKQSTWQSFKNTIYKSYGENPGTMLVHTGAVGWILSSLAQVCAVIFNDKISPEQKMFLIPQEMGDAAVNIISFYTLTSGVKYIGKKLTQTAKLRTKDLSNVLKERGLILEKGQERVKGKVYAGDWDFDVTKLDNYKEEIQPVYKPFNNGAEVITGLVGSIMSSNIVTPILRNLYASKRQQDMLTVYNNVKEKRKKMSEFAKPEQQTVKPQPLSVSMDTFRKNAMYSPYIQSYGMKI